MSRGEEAFEKVVELTGKEFVEACGAVITKGYMTRLLLADKPDFELVVQIFSAELAAYIFDKEVHASLEGRNESAEE